MAHQEKKYTLPSKEELATISDTIFQKQTSKYFELVDKWLLSIDWARLLQERAAAGYTSYREYLPDSIPSIQTVVQSTMVKRGLNAFMEKIAIFFEPSDIKISVWESFIEFEW